MDGQRQVDHLIERHPELDAALSRRDVGMRIGRDLRVHPDADDNLSPLPRRDAAERVKLVGRFEMDVADTGLYRGVEFPERLADAAEHNPFGREPGGEGPQHLTARHDVGAGAEVT